MLKKISCILLAEKEDIVFNLKKGTLNYKISIVLQQETISKGTICTASTKSIF